MTRHHPRPHEEPKRWGAAFVLQEANETAARIAQGIDSPWLVPVHAATPTVIYGAPLDPARPTFPLPVADAVTCALQVCDVLARLHAAGWVGLGSDAQDIRVAWEAGAWRASVLVPHLPSPGRSAYADIWFDVGDPVARDLRAIVAFVRDLVDGYVPVTLATWGSTGEYRSRPLPPLGDPAVDVTLAGMLGPHRDPTEPAPPAAPEPESAVELARLLAPLSHDPAGWSARFAALVPAHPRALRKDWNRLVTLGEQELRVRPDEPFVTLPFARALHQRACVAFAGGDLTAAEHDLERCITVDPWFRYRVTRATFRAARGDRAGALAELDAVLAELRNPEPLSEDDALLDPLRAWVDLGWDGGRSAAREAARALYARGVLRYHLGDLLGARADLDEAIRTDGLCSALFPYAAPSDLGLRPHQALATVLRTLAGRGDSDARKALVTALYACGRHDEARAVAGVVLAEHPDDPKLRKKFARWFPGG